MKYLISAGPISDYTNLWLVAFSTGRLAWPTCGEDSFPSRHIWYIDFPFILLDGDLLIDGQTKRDPNTGKYV